MTIFLLCEFNSHGGILSTVSAYKTMDDAKFALAEKAKKEFWELSPCGREAHHPKWKMGAFIRTTEILID